jgi:hypothetical protein
LSSFRSIKEAHEKNNFVMPFVMSAAGSESESKLKKEFLRRTYLGFVLCEVSRNSAFPGLCLDLFKNETLVESSLDKMKIGELAVLGLYLMTSRSRPELLAKIEKIILSHMNEKTMTFDAPNSNKGFDLFSHAQAILFLIKFNEEKYLHYFQPWIKNYYFRFLLEGNDFYNRWLAELLTYSLESQFRIDSSNFLVDRIYSRLARSGPTLGCIQNFQFNFPFIPEQNHLSGLLLEALSFLKPLAKDLKNWKVARDRLEDCVLRYGHDYGNRRKLPISIRNRKDQADVYGHLILAIYNLNFQNEN